MNAPCFKIILLLLFVFIFTSMSAQEKKERRSNVIEAEWDRKPIEEPRLDPVNVLMRPRWIMPHLEIRPGNSTNRIGVANSAMEPAVVRLIFYDYVGNVQKVDETTLEGRHSFLTGFSHSQFPENDFQGYMVMEATSPATFITAYNMISVNKKTLSIPIQVFRIDY